MGIPVFLGGKCTHGLLETAKVLRALRDNPGHCAGRIPVAQAKCSFLRSADTLSAKRTECLEA